MEALKRSLALACLFASSAVLADDAEIAKGLQNLRQVHEIANLLELRRATPALRTETSWLPDPWGHPYRIEETGSSYRIIGAGSDGKFEEPVAGATQQFAGTEGDVVFANGLLVRSNRNWLHARVDANGPSAAAIEQLRRAEIQFAVMRDRSMQVLADMRVTALAMQTTAELVRQGKEVPTDVARDAWGTPLRVLNEGGAVRIVSAGADRKFDPESWWLEPRADAAEDIVFEGGHLTRRVTDRNLLRGVTLHVAPVPQPPDPPLADTGERWLMIDPSIVAPVATKRVEPQYPEDYRRLGVSGIVIVQAAISETGVVEEVRVLKSLAPDLDMAAAAALRQWTFQPATRHGQTVPVLFNLTIHFTVN